MCAAARTVVRRINATVPPGEPWLFALDGTGRIVSRHDGAGDRTEIHDLFVAVVD